MRTNKGENIKPNTKAYLFAFLGRPEDHRFNPEDYAGSYGGLINILGLRHKGIVIAGSTLYRKVCKEYDVELDRWDFMHELSLWCIQYVGVTKVTLGKQHIIRGQIDQGSTRYFCVPAKAMAKLEKSSHAFN